MDENTVSTLVPDIVQHRRDRELDPTLDGGFARGVAGERTSEYGLGDQGDEVW